METVRQVAASLLIAAFSVALVVGGISLAMAESYVPEIPTVTETQAPTSIFATHTAGVSLTAPTQTVALLNATPLTPSATVPPPTSCPPPSGWIAVSVQPGETLATLATRYRTTPENLSAANCLFSSNLPTGSIVYVPPVPTQTSVPCGPPFSWVRYTVQPGDTLTSLSQAYAVSIAQLQFANCMASNQYYLSVGQTIRVPNVATRTPRATATKTLTPVSIIFPTLTWTVPPTLTPTDTPPSPTVQPPTLTPSSTATIASPTATNTTVPSATFTPPPTPTPTQ